MIPNNRTSAFLPVFSSSISTPSREAAIFLAINNFLKDLQDKARTVKIESLRDRDMRLTPNDRLQINNLLDLAPEEETFTLLEIADFDDEPWLYQVIYSFILHYSKTILDKISENLSNLNNNPDVLISLCQNELWQASNTMLILADISLSSEFASTLFVNILEYYTRLLNQKNTIHIVNVIAHTTQQPLMKISEFRLKPENRTQSSEMLLDKLNKLIQNVANKRMTLSPPTKEKQYKAKLQPLSAAGRNFVANILNILNGDSDFSERLNKLSSISDKLEIMSISDADSQVIRDLLYFAGFSLRSPKEFSFVDHAHPTLELLRVYYFYEGLYKTLPERLQSDGHSVAIEFQQFHNMLARSFACIIEQTFITQLTLYQTLNEPGPGHLVKVKASKLGRHYKLPTIADVRNIDGQNLSEVANILFALTVEQAASLDEDSDKIEEILFLFESLLAAMPEFFVRYPQVFNRYENANMRYLSHAMTSSQDENTRIIYQTNLRKVMGLIEDNVQNSSPQSQLSIEPIFLRLNDLIFASIKQKTTPRRASIELAAHNDWALNRGHPEFRTTISPTIVGWYSKIIGKIEEDELWAMHLQETFAMKINPDGAADALMKVDASILDSALKSRLKVIFDSVFRLQTKIDPLRFCRDETSCKRFLSIIEVFYDLLQKELKNQEDKMENSTLLHAFITNIIMKLAQRLQDNRSQEQIESARIHKFIVDLIALCARLFRAEHEVEFIMNWYTKLEYTFPSQKFLFDGLNSLLAETNARGRHLFKPII